MQCASLPGESLRAGSVGRPLPGVDVSVIDGKLAVRQGKKPGFLGYWKDEDRLLKQMRGEWFLTSHPARIDQDGYVYL